MLSPAAPFAISLDGKLGGVAMCRLKRNVGINARINDANIIIKDRKTPAPSRGLSLLTIVSVAMLSAPRMVKIELLDIGER